MRRRQWRDRIVVNLANRFVNRFASEWYIARFEFIMYLGQRQYEELLKSKGQLDAYHILDLEHKIEKLQRKVKH